MERILSDNEKIRKAEEIYFRRNNKSIPIKSKENVRKNYNAKNKIFLQLIILIDIAIIVFCVQNKDFIFTQEFLGMLNNYNQQANSKIIEFFSGILKEEDNEQNINQNEIEEKQEETKESNQVEQNIQPEESSSISEMDLDVQNLNAAYSFIKPINGIISSGFGARESEYQNVTGYHTGIDIAADKGTVIKSAMQGIVELVSSEGDYGKHIKIRCNNVTTLYAHCSKIYVKEGQIVGQNQSIGEVGSTGNSTGPHLHFERRVDDRFVDPLRIVNFN